MYKVERRRWGMFFASREGLFLMGKEAKSPSACYCLGVIGDFEFAEDITDMMLNCAGCDHQCFRNLLVRGTACEQVEHFLFTRA
jgi:hypothetical protein